MILYDAQKDSLIAARDPIGIRPLFYGYRRGRRHRLCQRGEEPRRPVRRASMPFPPGHYYCRREVRPLRRPHAPSRSTATDDLDTVCRTIREKLIAGVEKRLDADAPLGFLLSGGLDSSLVCAISAKLLGKKIRTFAIGMDLDPIDLKYAREVADYHRRRAHGGHHDARAGARHAGGGHLACSGTYDITTIRASMGMYLCCKAIHEQTDVRVLLTGEISDELFGYKYTDFAPVARGLPAGGKKACG